MSAPTEYWLNPRLSGGFDERLLWAGAAALLLHSLVIFGVRFERPTPAPRPPLEIILTHAPPSTPPVQAKLRAPQNQTGDQATPQVNTVPRPAKAPPVATTPPPPPPKPTAAARAVSSHAESPHKIAEAPSKALPLSDAEPRLDMAAVQRQISEFSNEFAQAQERYAQRNKMLYVNSVSAHKYEAAAYERAWQEKIERIGNLNYPDAARRAHLTGSLLLSVAVRSDGSVHSIKVRQTAGYPVLDEAAKNIVKLAAPFAPFPAGLKEEADVLVITRTWKFFSDAHLSTAP